MVYVTFDIRSKSLETELDECTTLVEIQEFLYEQLYVNQGQQIAMTYQDLVFRKPTDTIGSMLGDQQTGKIKIIILDEISQPDQECLPFNPFSLPSILVSQILDPQNQSVIFQIAGTLFTLNIDVTTPLSEIIKFFQDQNHLQRESQIVLEVQGRIFTQQMGTLETMLCYTNNNGDINILEAVHSMQNSSSNIKDGQQSLQYEYQQAQKSTNPFISVVQLNKNIKQLKITENPFPFVLNNPQKILKQLKNPSMNDRLKVPLCKLIFLNQCPQVWTEIIITQNMKMWQAIIRLSNSINVPSQSLVVYDQYHNQLFYDDLIQDIQYFTDNNNCLFYYQQSVSQVQGNDKLIVLNIEIVNGPKKGYIAVPVQRNLSLSDIKQYMIEYLGYKKQEQIIYYSDGIEINPDLLKYTPEQLNYKNTIIQVLIK